MNHAMSGSRAEAAERRGNRGERRKRQIPVAMEHRKRQRRGERRRQVDPTTCEREYTDDEISFMRAMDQYSATIADRSPPGAKCWKSCSPWATEESPTEPSSRGCTPK